MALYLLQPGLEPLGHYDFLDTDITSVLGGEIAVLDEASRTNTTTEKASADSLDGYVADEVDIGTPTATRLVARIADGYSTTFLDATRGDSRVEPRKAFYLTDDGTANYGTLYGSLIGNPAGLGVAGSQIGPHTAQGSGKVTLWDKPGVYAVSTDAVADDLNHEVGNLNDTPLPGELLYREHNTGKLTVSSVAADDKIALFIELASDGSLVTTPARLVGATETFDRIVIQYLGATFSA